MSGIKTSLINIHALSGTIHGKTSGDTIVAAAGGHHQISGQFVSMRLTNTGQLVKAVAVDVSISIGIVANRGIGSIIVSLAVAVFVIATTNSFAVGITMDPEFGAIPSNKQMFFVQQTSALGFCKTTTI